MILAFSLLSRTTRGIESKVDPAVMSRHFPRVPSKPAEYMSIAARSATHDSNGGASGLQLLGSELDQVRSVLRALLSQRTAETIEQWRRAVLHDFMVLTCSDKAILILSSPSGRLVYGDQVGPELLSSYANRFADLDRGPRAAREFGLEVWSLWQLWQPGELERSQYYRSFMLPNRLFDGVGVTLQLVNPSTEICMVFYRARPGSTVDMARRRELLGLMLEPLRAALRVDLGAIDPMTDLSSLIDVCGQALALFSLDGRRVKQNPVMLRVLAQDPERDAVQRQIREVARSVLATLAHGRRVGGKSSAQAEGTRREVATSQAAYRLRGNPVGRNNLGHGTAILVSLDRVAFQIPAPDSLRARYGLTVRELHVASLLMHRLTNAEIARMLSISPHTARHHTENVLAKLAVRSREALRRLVTDGVPG
jgi:DNA-binding CsgD family transcriptional regulator